MLRAPATGQPRRKATAKVIPLPAPVRGWNTRDQFAEGPESLLYAPIMDNWHPTSGRLETRRGFSPHATGMGTGDVTSLMSYAGSDGTTGRRLFAVCGGSIFDVTAEAPVGPAAVTGLSNGLFSHTMFSTTSGSYLVCTNGADGIRTYNGATQAWATQTVSGISAAELNHVAAHKGRLWFVERSSLSAWYLAPYAIAGALTEFDIGPLCSKGGHIVALDTWSSDGGAGPDDYFVLVTSQGQVVVYAGVDPGFADTWRLVGVFEIDLPLGRRCLLKFGADLLVLTQSGIVELSKVIQSISGRSGLSDVIGDQFVQAANWAPTSPHWEMLVYPTQSWLIANVPGETAGLFRQYVYSTIEKAWFRFTGQNARCWALLGDHLYFGGTGGTVYHADHGRVDDGSSIYADLQMSWSRYGTPLSKRFTMVRPHFFADGAPKPALEMKLDYDGMRPLAALATSPAPPAAEWDLAAWDEEEWAGSFLPWGDWAAVRGDAAVAAPRMSVSNAGAALAFAGIEVAFEPGNGL
jgi:hypothetical protein